MERDYSKDIAVSEKEAPRKRRRAAVSAQLAKRIAREDWL